MMKWKNAVQNKKAINQNTKKHIPSQKGSKKSKWKEIRGQNYIASFYSL